MLLLARHMSTGLFSRVFTRFVLMSDAFVVMPGGIGSVLEGNDDLATPSGRAPPGHPLILAGKMYSDIAWCRHHVLRPELNLANPEDITLPRCVDDGPGILHILRTPLGLRLGNRRLPADLLFDAAETR